MNRQTYCVYGFMLILLNIFIYLYIVVIATLYMLHLHHGSLLHKRMGQATELLVYTVWIHIQTMLGGRKDDPKGDMLLFV